MRATRPLWLLLILWASLYIWSLAGRLLLPSPTDAFLAEWQDVSVLATGQFLAAMVALILAVLARRADPLPRPAMLFRLPLYLTAFSALVVIFAVGAHLFSR